MKIFSSLFFLCLSCLIWAQDKTLSLKTDEGPLTLYKKDKVWVSKDCLSVPCSALKKPQISRTDTKSNQWAGHPAADFCVRSGGSYLVGTHPKGDQDGICRFKDSSFILSWDYYQRNKEKK